MEKGIVPCDGKGAPTEAPAPEATKVFVAPEDGDDRAALIEPVLEAIAARNKATEFSAGGVPLAAVVSMSLGWKVDQKEVRPIWDKIKIARVGK
jgi:hypothetical protein